MESEKYITYPCIYYLHPELLFSLFLFIFLLNLLHDKFSFLNVKFDVGSEGGFEALGERKFSGGLGVSTSIGFLPLGHIGFANRVFLFLILEPLWMVVGCFHVHSDLVALIILVSMMGAPLELDPTNRLGFAVEGEAPRIQGGSLARRFAGIDPGLLSGAVGIIVRVQVLEILLVELGRHGDDLRVLLVQIHPCPRRGIVGVELDEFPDFSLLIESIR